MEPTPIRTRFSADRYKFGASGSANPKVTCIPRLVSSLNPVDQSANKRTRQPIRSGGAKQRKGLLNSLAYNPEKQPKF
jgi:hypothetical protein